MLARAATSADAPAITRIYNDGIAGRQATFETEPRSVAEIAAHLRDMATHPAIVVVDGERVIGFAWSAVYLRRPCYDRISEFSVYVASDARRRGAGRRALAALAQRCEQLGFWKLTSRIISDNLASRALCAQLGFREVGEYRRHGRLDGVWKDCVIVELLLGEAARAAAPGSGAARGVR